MRRRGLELGLYRSQPQLVTSGIRRMDKVLIAWKRWIDTVNCLKNKKENGA